MLLLCCLLTNHPLLVTCCCCCFDKAEQKNDNLCIVPKQFYPPQSSNSCRFWFHRKGNWHLKSPRGSDNNAFSAVWLAGFHFSRSHNFCPGSRCSMLPNRMIGMQLIFLSEDSGGVSGTLALRAERQSARMSEINM